MAKKNDNPEQRGPVIENRKARFDFEILSTLEVGIMLRGSEVKSVREGKISLGEGYVRAEEHPPGLYLHAVTIDPYGPAGPAGNGRQHLMSRARQLLAHKKEIVKLARESKVKGMTIVPLKLYFKDGWAKLLIGVARGKTRGDKRQTIAKRDAQRDIQRAMSRRR